MTTSTDTAARLIRVGHSPDPDDAFMFYALASCRVVVPGVRIEHVLEDIESLNRRALQGELEVTAVSAHAYAYLADRYWIMRAGASVGRKYGPKLVAREATGWTSPADLRGKRVAIPGTMTTAALVLQLAVDGVETVAVPFDEILDAVTSGGADAGLVIHEGQLTYGERGLRLLLDLGEWWHDETGGLPLPLGLDVVRSDLGRDLAEELSRGLREAIDYAIAHEDEALPYALQFGRGIPLDTARRFVRMYVNADTQDLGPEGERALRLLYDRAHARGIMPRVPELVIV
jgi:1,4-dihydroxy-6-naphthoate synthase